MSKKKPRANGAAPAAAAGANAPTSELPTADINAALQQRYRALAADVLALPAALERTLWLHNAALLLVQHALLYDEVRAALRYSPSNERKLQLMNAQRANSM